MAPWKDEQICSHRKEYGPFPPACQTARGSQRGGGLRGRLKSPVVRSPVPTRRAVRCPPRRAVRCPRAECCLHRSCPAFVARGAPLFFAACLFSPFLSGVFETWLSPEWP